jgi:hypothetical protein
MNERDLKSALNSFNEDNAEEQVKPLEIPDAQAKREDKQTLQKEDWDYAPSLSEQILKRSYASDEVSPLTWPGMRPCDDCE